MPPRSPKACRDCGAPIRFVREVDTNRTLVLNDNQIEGGTVVLLGDRAQVVPPGRGPGFSLHTCARRRG